MQLQAKMLAPRLGREYHDSSVLQRGSDPLSGWRISHAIDFVFSEPIRSPIARWNILAPPSDFRAAGVQYEEAASPLTGPDDQVMAMRRPTHTEAGSVQLDRPTRITFDIPNFWRSRIPCTG